MRKPERALIVMAAALVPPASWNDFSFTSQRTTQAARQITPDFAGQKFVDDQKCSRVT